MSTIDQRSELRNFLKQVFDHYSHCKPADGAIYDRRLCDFQFHMTDWMTDLMPFVGAMFQPDTPAKPEALSALFAFLNHAVPHLVGAREAMDGRVMEHTFPPPIAAPGEHDPAPKRVSTRRRVGAKA